MSPIVIGIIGLTRLVIIPKSYFVEGVHCFK